MATKRLIEPIVLMCSERSGSNLITRIFDAHPKVAAPGASHLFRVFSELACRYRDQEEDLRVDLLEIFGAKLGVWLIDMLPRQELRDLLNIHESAAEMIAALMEAERKLAGKAYFFVKELSIYHFIPFIESVSFGSRYVFMVRDPRDMALSWHNAAVLRGGVVHAAKRWMEDQEGFMKVLSWMSNTHPVAVLTYEALVSRPEETLRKVCAELRLDFHPHMLDFNNHSRSANVDSSRAKILENISRPLMRDNFGKFHSGLNDDQLAYIEAFCGPLMAAFGYHKARPKDSPPFGRFESFELLKTALMKEEPWDKRQYMDLSADERIRAERWTALHSRLRQRSWPQFHKIKPANKL